jgi:hypothetical protein|tara:strand:+ start:1189 stop:1884 length:696 start_codon:yes stop_codon:yes gene_type:complete
MAVSGSKDFELDVADYIEEAFERCGLELRTAYDLKTARRSLNLLLAEWANRGLNQWTIQQKTVAMVSGTTTYNVDSSDATAAIDVLDAFMRQTVGNEDVDIQMTRLSRSEYSSIPNKSTTGKPLQFFVDKQISPTISVYPTPDATTTYTIHLNVLTRMDDVDSATNTLQLPFRFYPCLAAGLAYYISVKKSPDRTGLLKQIYEEEFQRALEADEDRASFRITPDISSYNIA